MTHCRHTIQGGQPRFLLNLILKYFTKKYGTVSVFIQNGFNYDFTSAHNFFVLISNTCEKNCIADFLYKMGKCVERWILAPFVKHLEIDIVGSSVNTNGNDLHKHCD